MTCLSRGSAAALAAMGLAMALVGGVRLEAAALLPAQQERVSAVDASLQKAADLCRKHKFDELGKLVDSIQKSVAELKEGEGQQQIAPQIEQLELRLASAQKLLKYALESATAGNDMKNGDMKNGDNGKKKLAARKPMAKAKPMVVAKVNPATKMPMMAGRKPAGNGGISYASQIGPLLQGKCGRCHGNNPKGNFSVATYADIRKGSDSGVVFYPGKGQGSRLIELLESGEMPKGGAKLSPDEIAMVTKWIDMGAEFDGEPASMVAAGGSQAPTGNETVSFMNDVAPILVGQCTRCHGGERGADNMELDTFARLMKGGRDGAIVMPGSPTSSLIVQMIEGTARDKVGPRRRMPDRSPPLAKAAIEKIKTWIAEGAKFDGDDQNATLEFQLRVLKAGKATHEELSKIRDEEAKKNWALANPGVTPITIEEDSFRLLGDLPPVRMKEVAEMAKGIQAKVASALRAPSGKPMYKGRLTIFVVAKRFEYSEFGQMVEKREITADSFGHFRYNVVDGYVCVLSNQENDPNLPLLLAEGFAGSYIETLGKNLPRWFTIGSGRAVAAKMEPRAPLVKGWDELAITAGGSVGSLDQFLKSKELDARGAALAYEIGKGMAPRLQAALDAMRKGANFQQAIMRAYGAAPANVAASWVK